MLAVGVAGGHLRSGGMQKKVEKRSTKGIDSRTCYGNEIDVDMAEKRRKKGGRRECGRQ